ncbi:hypothetical protein [Streptacidiphilus albus]|uniref:hypothetical protein n=1 Tax=Streptacidiphilus albus TaxID=105425 RepID=UPI000690AE33|nr:hypothetical protein [Streptacidiphilus albus]
MPLTLDRRHRLPGSPLSAGYWCEALAHTPQDGRSFQLGSASTPTPRLALRWLLRRTQDVLDQLEPTVTWPAHEWLVDRPEHERALAALTRGETYTLSISEDTTHYVLTARPTGSTQ